jgi:hypothetical protein
LEELTSEQISEWEAYDRLDPIGTYREDFRMAVIASQMTNLMIQAHGKKGSKLTDTADFMPKWGEDTTTPKVQSMEEIKKALMSIASTHNKSIDKKKRK